MTLDNRMRAAAKRLADKYGKSLSLIRVTTSYNPATGESTETEASHSVTAVPPRSFDVTRIDGSMIQSGDVLVSVPAKGLDMGDPDKPQTDDKARMDGRDWQIVQVGRVYSGEQVALYELHLRR